MFLFSSSIEETIKAKQWYAVGDGCRDKFFFLMDGAHSRDRAAKPTIAQSV